MFQKNTWISLALGSVLLVAFAIRFWYASAELHLHRFEDEQYSLTNVRKIYLTGAFEPESGYYPSPVFNLPQVILLRASEALHKKTKNPRFAVVDESGEFLPTAFLLTRFIQVVCGTLTVLLVFLIGRLMFSPQVGLLGALIFAVLPWTIHASGYNKPDAMLVFGIALSFYASLLAVQRPTPLRHAATGMAIAFTMSCKLTGGLIALPLVLATLVNWRDARRWWLLVLAGATSVATFIAANPYWPAYLSFLEGLKRDYATRTDDSHWTIPLKVIGFLTDPFAHGSLGGILALIGLAWIAVRLWPHRTRRSSSRTARLERGMFLIFPLSYVATYAVQTAYFKPNNFLTILPFTSLALAFVLIELERRLRHRIVDSRIMGDKAIRGRAFTTIIVAICIVWLGRPGCVYAYHSLVPTTWDAASRFLDRHLQPAGGRLVYSEPWDVALPRWEGGRPFQRGRSGYRMIDDLTAEDTDVLDRADGLLFRSGNRSDFATERAARVPKTQVRTFRAAPFRRRGPEVMAIAHPRQLLQPPKNLDVRPCSPVTACMKAELPSQGPTDELISFLVWVPAALAGRLDGIPELTLNQEVLEMTWLGYRGGGHLLISERVERPNTASTLRFRHDDPPIETTDPLVVVQVQRWRNTPESPCERVPSSTFESSRP